MVFRATLVDVGGTLLPNALPPTPHDVPHRRDALTGTLGPMENEQADALVNELLRVVQGGENDLDWTADLVLAEALERRGHSSHRASAVRKALCLPLVGRLVPHEGAEEHLQGMYALGRQTVIVSNTSFRDGEAYRADFEAFGWSRWIRGYVTSVEVGRDKPDPAIFLHALVVAGCGADETVMIGNSESADIVGAKAPGIRTMRVAIEDPVPGQLGGLPLLGV